MFLLDLNYLLLVNTPLKATVWQFGKWSPCLKEFQNDFLRIKDPAIPLTS